MYPMRQNISIFVFYLYLYMQRKEQIGKKYTKMLLVIISGGRISGDV